MSSTTERSGRRRHTARTHTAEDQALNQIAKEAESRIAAKRAERAQAREIRMKELERLQKENEDKSDRVYESTSNDYSRGSGKTRITKDEGMEETRDLKGSGKTRITKDEGMEETRDLKSQLNEVEEKFKKAMMNTALLDNEKQALIYQVDLLKDKLDTQEEELTELLREHKDKCRQFDQHKRSYADLERDFNGVKEMLAQREKLIQDHGLVIVGTESGELTLAKNPDSNGPVVQLGAALVSPEAAKILEQAGEGSLGTTEYSKGMPKHGQVLEKSQDGETDGAPEGLQKVKNNEGICDNNSDIVAGNNEINKSDSECSQVNVNKQEDLANALISDRSSSERESLLSDQDSTNVEENTCLVNESKGEIERKDGEIADLIENIDLVHEPTVGKIDVFDHDRAGVEKNESAVAETLNSSLTSESTSTDADSDSDIFMDAVEETHTLLSSKENVETEQTAEELCKEIPKILVRPPSSEEQGTDQKSSSLGPETDVLEKEKFVSVSDIPSDQDPEVMEAEIMDSEPSENSELLQHSEPVNEEIDQGLKDASENSELSEGESKSDVLETEPLYEDSKSSTEDIHLSHDSDDSNDDSEPETEGSATSKENLASLNDDEDKEGLDDSSEGNNATLSVQQSEPVNEEIDQRLNDATEKSQDTVTSPENLDTDKLSTSLSKSDEAEIDALVECEEISEDESPNDALGHQGDLESVGQQEKDLEDSDGDHSSDGSDQDTEESEVEADPDEEDEDLGVGRVNGSVLILDPPEQNAEPRGEEHLRDIYKDSESSGAIEALQKPDTLEEQTEEASQVKDARSNSSSEDDSSDEDVSENKDSVADDQSSGDLEKPDVCEDTSQTKDDEPTSIDTSQKADTSKDDSPNDTAQILDDSAEKVIADADEHGEVEAAKGPVGDLVNSSQILDDSTKKENADKFEDSSDDNADEKDKSEHCEGLEEVAKGKVDDLHNKISEDKESSVSDTEEAENKSKDYEKEKVTSPVHRRPSYLTATDDNSSEDESNSSGDPQLAVEASTVLQDIQKLAGSSSDEKEVGSQEFDLSTEPVPRTAVEEEENANLTFDTETENSSDCVASPYIVSEDIKSEKTVPGIREKDLDEDSEAEDGSEYTLDDIDLDDESEKLSDIGSFDSGTASKENLADTEGSDAALSPTGSDKSLPAESVSSAGTQMKESSSKDSAISEGGKSKRASEHKHKTKSREKGRAARPKKIPEDLGLPPMSLAEPTPVPLERKKRSTKSKQERPRSDHLEAGKEESPQKTPDSKGHKSGFFKKIFGHHKP